MLTSHRLIKLSTAASVGDTVGCVLLQLMLSGLSLSLSVSYLMLTSVGHLPVCNVFPLLITVFTVKSGGTGLIGLTCSLLLATACV